MWQVQQYTIKMSWVIEVSGAHAFSFTTRWIGNFHWVFNWGNEFIFVSPEVLGSILDHIWFELPGVTWQAGAEIGRDFERETCRFLVSNFVNYWCTIMNFGLKLTFIWGIAKMSRQQEMGMDQNWTIFQYFSCMELDITFFYFFCLGWKEIIFLCGTYSWASGVPVWICTRNRWVCIVMLYSRISLTL